MNPQVPTHTHRPDSRYGLRWLLWLLLLGLGGLTQQAQAQLIYGSKSPNSTEVDQYNIATNSWTTLPPAPDQKTGDGLAYDGTYLYASTENNLGTNFYRYNPATSTWSPRAVSPGTSSSGQGLVYDGSQYIYSAKTTSGGVAGLNRYNIATNSWTTLPDPPSILNPGITYDGTYLYATVFLGASFLRYNIATSTWTTLAASPGTIFGGLVYDGSQYIYGNEKVSSGGLVDRYNIATNSWTTLPAAPENLYPGITYDGTYLYADGATALQRYNPATSTWTTLAAVPGPGADLFSLVFACATPGFVASVSQATCSGSTANSNGTIQISSVSNGARVGFSAGNTYTGPAFASATTFAGPTAPVTNTLANPTAAQPYTIRVFCNAGTFFDQTVTLNPTQCLTANLSLAVAPPTQTKNPGDVATYVYTLTNAGPSAAPNVQVKVYVPANATLVSSVPQSGTYDEGTNIWTIPSVAVGSQTLSLSVRIN